MRFFLIPTFFITLVGLASIVAFESLNKQEQFDKARFENAIRVANWGGLALYGSPLIAHFLLCVLGRNRHPFAGFVVAVFLAVVTALGNLTDWMLWKDRPAPQDQITYLAGFYAACVGWGIVIVFWLVVAWMRSGTGRQPTEPKSLAA